MHPSVVDATVLVGSVLRHTIIVFIEVSVMHVRTDKQEAVLTIRSAHFQANQKWFCSKKPCE